MHAESLSTTSAAHALGRRLLRCCADPRHLSQAVSWRLQELLAGRREPVEKGALRLFWYRDEPNLGDLFSALLVEQVAGMQVAHARPFERRKLLAVGSVLEYARTGDLVWGSGAIEAGLFLREKDFTVTAVRGPKTRQILLSQGVACPEVYGDPAVLTAELYPRPAGTAPRYRLGIVPHYRDKGLFAGWEDPSVLVLDIQGDRETFFHDLWQCERVVSSSLHGIIFAESYGIPAHWLKLSDELRGGDFKFHDYYLGTGREPLAPLSLHTMRQEPQWTAPRAEKEKLLAAFPREALAGGKAAA